MKYSSFIIIISLLFSFTNGLIKRVEILKLDEDFFYKVITNFTLKDQNQITFFHNTLQNHCIKLRNQQFGYFMGNEQPQKQQELKVQEIKPVGHPIHAQEVKFVQETKQQKKTNANKRKSIKPVLQEKFNVQPSHNEQPKANKKQSTKSEFPPLKVSNMKATGNENNQIHTTTFSEEIEEVKYQKLCKTVPVTKRNQLEEYFQDNGLQDQKQNNDLAGHLRPKKFRPSIHHQTKKLTQISSANVNQITNVQQITQINVI